MYEKLEILFFTAVIAVSLALVFPYILIIFSKILALFCYTHFDSNTVKELGAESKSNNIIFLIYIIIFMLAIVVAVYTFHEGTYHPANKFRNLIIFVKSFV